MSKPILKYSLSVGFLIGMVSLLQSQSLGNFTSVKPNAPDHFFHIPEGFTFQYLIETGDIMSDGKPFPGNPDFTGYVPIDGSSTNGYLSINSELTVGGASMMDVALNTSSGLWEVSNSKAVDFSAVSGTSRNCSGAITPWGTIISCEESGSSDLNAKGYRRLGWAIELDPVTKKIIDQEGGISGDDKLWAMGNFAHENASVHPNRRTVYQGIDAQQGYLYKFVADEAENLSSGKLYVYKGPKSGNGAWIQIPNTTVEERNLTVLYSSQVDATLFLGVEDVEYNPIDDLVYFAVKNEDRVYRFKDDNPLEESSVTGFETFVGGQNYTIDYGTGTKSIPWGIGNDNLAIDDLGNLWVYQDGGDNLIWVVENGHTQANPKVKLFGRSPVGGEPTGITFTPDFKYLFMSFQNPSSPAASTQLDAAGNLRAFNKSVSIVIARDENLGNSIDPNNNITFNCSADISIEAGEGEVDAILVYAGPNVQAVCDESTDISVTQIAGLPSVSRFPIGVTNNEFEATVTCGEEILTATCSFTVTVTSAEVDTIDCEENIDGFEYLGEHDTHHYYLSASANNWTNAQAIANELGGHLAAINNEEENEFIRSNISAITLIGLNDISAEGSYRWDGESEFSFQKTISNNSNVNNFGTINFWNGDWDMVNAQVEKPFIIELDCGDITPPDPILTIACPDDLRFEVQNANETVDVVWGEVTTSTTCPEGGIDIKQIFGPNNGSSFGVGQATTISYQVTDACGNMEVCSFEITVVLVDDNECLAKAIEGFEWMGEYNNHHYYLSASANNWTTAQSISGGEGGYLVSINSKEENEFIAKLIDGIYLIGLTDEATEENFSWADGTTIGYSNLSSSNSDALDFGVINFWDGSWGLANQWVEKKFIMEVPCSDARPSQLRTETLKEIRSFSRLYPNPTNENTKLETFSQSEKKIKLKLYDAFGKLLLQKEHWLTKGQNLLELNTQKLTPGIYFLQLPDAISLKLIKL